MAKTPSSEPIQEVPSKMRGTIVNDPEEIEYRPIAGHPGYRIAADGSVWSCLQRVINWLRAKFIMDLRPEPTPQADTWHPIGGSKNEPM